MYSISTGIYFIIVTITIRVVQVYSEEHVRTEVWYNRLYDEDGYAEGKQRRGILQSPYDISGCSLRYVPVRVYSKVKVVSLTQYYSVPEGILRLSVLLVY